MEKAEKKKGEKEIKLFSTRENKSYFEKESQKSRNNLIFVSKVPFLQVKFLTRKRYRHEK